MPNASPRRSRRRGESLDASAVPLLRWYSRVRRDLPWRRDPSPYAVWVSEVMLQQTRVETVIPYYERFLARFPDVKALAEASVEDVLACWSGLGYYRRARSLHAAAGLLLEDYGGEFPRDLKSALSIPGIGRYTAGAILSIAYGQPVPVVDGNVERVLSRVLRLPGNPKTGRMAAIVRGVAAAWIPAGRASDFNQALMELGATVCVPSAPRCEECPLRAACRSRRHGDVHRFPRAARPRATVAVDVEAAVVRRGEEYLLEASRDAEILEGMWLFPLVPIAPASESTTTATESAPAQGLASELSAKLGVPLRAARFLGRFRHSITYRRMSVRVYELGSVVAGELERIERLPTGFRWSTLEALGDRVPVSSLTLKIARRLSDAATCRPTTRAGARGRRSRRDREG